MTSLAHLAHEVSPAAAAFLVASVWQGILLTAGVALLLRITRGIPPAVRTWIWAAVLVLVLLLPALGIVLPHRAMPAHAELHVAEDWAVAMLAVWAACVTFRGARLIGDGIRLWKLAHRAVPIAVDEPLACLLQTGRRAALCVSAEVNRPSVTGFFRPRVLLPEGLLERLTPAELECVVLHEMEHLRRGDDWLNLLQQVSLVLLPLNPALLWLDRRLCRERELACDDGVLQATKARSAYAACLVKLAEDSMMRKGLVLAMSALGARARESELVGRVRRILAGPERIKTRRGLPVVLGSLAAVALACVVCLARSPQWVSFDGASALMAQAAATSGVDVANASPRTVPSTGEQGLVHPLLTNAVAGPSGVTSLRPAVAIVSHRRLLRARMPRRVSALVLRSAEAEPVRRVSQDRPQRAPGVPALQPSAVGAAHLVVTEFEVSQPTVDATWAAVPWRGGWLILQL